MLNQNSTIPLYEQVKEAIKLKIEQKEWKENTRVPSETELMKIYEVSRVTVRNALALLVDEGYLEKKQGIGTFVSKPRIKKSFSIVQVLPRAVQVQAWCPERRSSKKKWLKEKTAIVKVCNWKRTTK